MDRSVLASLRFKLTFYYLAILSLVLVGFGVVLYAYLSRTLMTTIDSSLAAQIEQIERRVAFAAGGEVAVDGEMTDLLLQLSPQVTQILDGQGRIVDEVMVLTGDQLIPDPGELLASPLGETRFSTLRTEKGEPLRVATRRVPDPEGEPGTYFIRLGQSLVALEQARQRLLVGLGLAIPLVLLMGSFGGLILARQALRPVDRMTRIADRIGGGDLSERVPVPPHQDEIGRLAVTINQMIARLQAAFERQRQFSADASHELRTPLSVIRADLEIALRRERTIPEYQAVLTSTLEETVRLSRLVEDLLLLTRADVGRVELECQAVNFSTLGREVVEYLQPLAAQRRQTLTWTSDAPHDLVLPADPNRLRQMLINLIDNAVKFTSEGGEIALSLTEESGQALLRIRDTGRGIPTEDLPFIFDRFFRRSAMTSDRSAPGTGLGLSIVRWIVEAHGGSIDVVSRLGEGTEFLLRLPLADPTKPLPERRR